MIEKNSIKETLRVGSIEAAKLLGSVAAAAVLFAPHAVNHAIDTTTIHTQIAEFPADISFSPETTRFTPLNLATVYLDKTTFDIGADINITGVPRFENAEQIVDFVSPRRLAVYGSLANSSKEATEGYRSELLEQAARNFAGYELPRGLEGGAALYGLLFGLRKRRELQRLKGESTFDNISVGVNLTAALAVTAATSFAIASQNHQDWLASEPIPDNLVTIGAFAGTSLEGAAIDNPGLLTVVNNSIEYSKKLSARSEAQRTAFLKEVEPKLIEQLGNLEAPKKGEELIFVISDMHAGKAGIKLAKLVVDTLQQRFGPQKLRFVFNNGDLLYDPELQNASIKDQAGIIKHGKEILSPGNHDYGKTVDGAKKAGMIYPDGIKEEDGWKFYAKADPRITPFLQNPYFPNPNYTEENLGEDAYKAISKQPVDVVELHEPDALSALTKIPNLIEYLQTPADLTSCSGDDDIRNIPAALLTAGHLHDQYPIHIACNSDGTWTVINVQGTGGGANEAPTINNWSDPNGKPIKDVSFRVFYHKTKYKSFTGYASIVITPGEVVEPIQRIDIGTPSGKPFDTKKSLEKLLTKGAQNSHKHNQE